MFPTLHNSLLGWDQGVASPTQSAHWHLHLPLCAFFCKVPDLLAVDLVGELHVGAVEPHPDGQREQDPRCACSCHLGSLLSAWGACWVASDLPGHQIFSFPKVFGFLASNEKTTGTADDVCGLNPRMSLSGLHVTEIPRHCLWTAHRGLCQCDGGGRLGT